MTGLTILGYVFVALGIVTGIGGGMQYPIDLLNSDFMSYLTGGLVLITMGLALIKSAPQWLLLTALWITAFSIFVYMYGFYMPFWVLASGIIVVIGFGAWLTTLILKK